MVVSGMGYFEYLGPRAGIWELGYVYCITLSHHFRCQEHDMFPVAVEHCEDRRCAVPVQRPGPTSRGGPEHVVLDVRVQRGAGETTARNHQNCHVICDRRVM